MLFGATSRRQCFEAASPPPWRIAQSRQRRKALWGEDREHDILNGERSTQKETDAVTQRMEIEQRVRGVLAGLGVPYEVITIDAAYADTAAFCERYGFPLDHSANTIIVSSKKEPRQYCACLILATTRLDVNHTVRKLMGVSRASFASAEDTMALTGMMIGGVTVFALPRELPIYIDEMIMSLDYVILGGGSRSLKIKLSPEVLQRLPNTNIVGSLSI
jgi:prolyl-tRNA editing enzyme YbaK/EbsC (Cys-tRNA(Pro) deacylase)